MLSTVNTYSRKYIIRWEKREKLVIFCIAEYEIG
jgi:hypothetical protein